MKHLKSFEFFIFITALLGLFFQAGYAQTQPDLKLDTVSVSLLPEYNQPAVLVIYEVTLDDSLPLPQKLNFEIPAEAKVLSVINFTPEYRPFELIYQETRVGLWKELQFNARNRIIRIEYQDPNLIRSHDQRNYEFRWLSTYPVSSLVINAHRPPGASNIRCSPQLEMIENDPDVSPILSANFGKVSAGELFSLSIEYYKDPGNLAYPAFPVFPAVPIEGNSSGRTLPPIFVIFWMLLFSVAIIIIVGYFYLRFRAKETNKDEQIGLGEVIINPERQASFCPECGMRIKVGENYCSNCGTELRKPTPFEQFPYHKPQ